MVWLLGIVLFIIFLLVFPRFRKVVLVVGGLLVLGIIILIMRMQVQEQKAKSLIPVDQIVLTNLQLYRQFGSYQLSGEVQNNSGHELTGVTLDAKAYDCPTSAIAPNCRVVGEDKNVYLMIDVPSGQVRAINDTDVAFFDMPPIQGHFLWNYKITGTEGSN